MQFLNYTYSMIEEQQNIP